MLRFTKLEGSGNDFVLVDLRSQPAGSGLVDEAALAAALCDRHFGVGADGVLSVLAPSSSEAAARMRIHNADGSEAEMCGNGIRCVAKYLYERDAETRRPELAIETAAGVRSCAVFLDGRRHVTDVGVAMGRPRLSRGEVPMAGPAGEHFVDQEIVADGRLFRATAVSMGNPHLVLFLDEEEDGIGVARRFGPALEHHPLFPHRCNAGFAKRRPDGAFDLWVWERGSGLTLACGTGACAAAVAACLTGRGQPGQELDLHLPGGKLHVTVDVDWEGVTLRGPVAEVFDGEIDHAALLARAGRRGARS